MKKIVLIFLVLSIISCAKEKDTITSNKGNNNSLVVNQKKLQEIKNKDSQKKLSYYRELKSRMEKFEKNIQKNMGMIRLVCKNILSFLKNGTKNSI